MSRRWLARGFTGPWDTEPVMSGKITASQMEEWSSEHHGLWWEFTPVPTLWERIRAFTLGLYEFRRDFTTHYGEPLINTYDSGREWAHRLTLRQYEVSR